MRAEGCIVRPVFFAPWWWFVWAGGKRFSVRRGASVALAVTVLAEIATAAGRYAFFGRAPALADVLDVARWSALAAAAYALLEPLGFVVVDSMRAGRWTPARLRDVSYGLQTLYAAALAFGAYLAAPHVPYLRHELALVRRENGWWGGTARYLLAGTLLGVPLVIVARLFALRAPRPRVATFPFDAPHAVPARPTPQAVHFADTERFAAPPVAPPPPVPIAPARIVKVDVRPPDP